MTRPVVDVGYEIKVDIVFFSCRKASLLIATMLDTPVGRLRLAVSSEAKTGLDFKVVLPGII